MSHEFRDGRRVAAIIYKSTNDSDGHRAKCDGRMIKHMSISMEPGQMGLVPWIKIFYGPASPCSSPALISVDSLEQIEFEGE